MDVAVASAQHYQLHPFSPPPITHTASWNQCVRQRPQPPAVIKRVVYTVHPDFTVWRQVVTDRMDVLQCSVVGRYIYFASQQQRVFVNAPWTPDDQTDPRDRNYYAAHRSHTPCAFSLMVNREPVRDQWSLLIDKLTHVLADHTCRDQTDSPAVKRLRLAPP